MFFLATKQDYLFVSTKKDFIILSSSYYKTTSQKLKNKTCHINSMKVKTDV